MAKCPSGLNFKQAKVHLSGKHKVYGYVSSLPVRLRIYSFGQASTVDSTIFCKKIAMHQDVIKNNGGDEREQNAS